MFHKLCTLTMAASMLALLAACGSSDDAMPAAQFDAPAVAAAPSPAAWFGSSNLGSPAPAAPAAPVYSPAQQPAGVHLVSESERVAEELRLVDFEQSFSIEMNRQAGEQIDRAQRAAAALRAGVVQAPGCEGTEGYAAEECERSVL